MATVEELTAWLAELKIVNAKATEAAAEGADATEVTKELTALKLKLEIAKEEDEGFAAPFTKNALKKAEKNITWRIKKGDKGKKKQGAASEKELTAEQKAKKAAKEKKKQKRYDARGEYVNKTPKGEKKSMDEPMANEYNPIAVESAWYDWWEKEGFFAGSNDPNDDREVFMMVIPPPNVTGSLHLGHALTNSIQDTLVRWHRMQGKNVLWLPGMDHAGIATQMVVEKRLMIEKGLRAKDMEREEFVGHVWNWKHEYHDKIANQLRRMGSALDWPREVFTVDERMSRAVQASFLKFNDDGIIFRDSRIVNWDCKLQTAISDVEVEYIDASKPTMITVPQHGDKKYEVGVLHYFAYPVDGAETPADTSEWDNIEGAQWEGLKSMPPHELIVATTRLETMLADTGVAVHPDDPRYRHLHGKSVVHPFSGRKIPIVCDPILVDMAFGTGAVKVTPCHDPNDHECGKRNKLEAINLLQDDGRINHVGGQFENMHRFDARFAVLDALKEKGLFRGKKAHEMNIGVCIRTKDVIEPIVKPQWCAIFAGL